MKKFGWFVLGIAGGFVVAHLVNKDPRGHELLSQVDARIGEFTDRMGDAYRDQEAQFVGLVAEAKDAVAGTAAAAQDAASDARASATEAAAKAADAAKNVTATLTD
ncbi:ATPase [Microbacterium sp. P07]|uniref:ATPase n=1 Tax=Microbacterium sp. P07 TaxID=3366952 RepID=UPI003744FC1E